MKTIKFSSCSCWTVHLLELCTFHFVFVLITALLSCWVLDLSQDMSVDTVLFSLHPLLNALQVVILAVQSQPLIWAARIKVGATLFQAPLASATAEVPTASMGSGSYCQWFSHQWQPVENPQIRTFQSRMMVQQKRQNYLLLSWNSAIAPRFYGQGLEFFCGQEWGIKCSCFFLQPQWLKIHYQMNSGILVI